MTPKWRQNEGRRCQIVQEFVKILSDDTERLICFLYMRNYSDHEVRKQLHLSEPRLEVLKLQLAIGLRNAGI